MKITNVNDYVEMVHNKFPEFTEYEIKRILVYFWKMILLYVHAGNDFLLKTPKDFFFIGNIPNNPLLVYNKYHKMLAKRIAFMFKRTKSTWDGHYYFTRNESLFKDYLLLKNKKIKVFNNVFLYKLVDEAKLIRPFDTYVFRVDEDLTSRMRKFYPLIKIKNVELIETRDSLKMKDMLTSYNKYKYIQ